MGTGKGPVLSAASANRTHIGFFGRMNAGKSSLINALTGQSVSIVSAQAGTTTDVVRKNMEIHGIGPCVLIDTAGFDDEGTLGQMRADAAKKAAGGADLAVIVLSAEGRDDLWQREKEWSERFTKSAVPVITVMTGEDMRSGEENAALLGEAERVFSGRPLSVSPVTGKGVDEVRKALIRAAGTLAEKRLILGDLVREGDVIMLVMPQDPQAPEGRLILPEVQTIREALDRHCIPVCVQPQEMEAALQGLKEPPALVVTDSQIFDYVSERCPDASALTSFSVLFAAFKGDIDYYVSSAGAIEKLTEDSRVLIAECCTHAPMDEDIGRVKIPALLRKKAGPGLKVDITAGADFPEDLASYDLVIQCGACMFNRRYVMSRIEKAKEAGVPMTNYGITIAHLKGILGKVRY